MRRDLPPPPYAFAATLWLVGSIAVIATAYLVLRLARP